LAVRAQEAEVVTEREAQHERGSADSRPSTVEQLQGAIVCDKAAMLYIQGLPSSFGILVRQEKGQTDSAGNVALVVTVRMGDRLVRGAAGARPTRRRNQVACNVSVAPEVALQTFDGKAKFQVQFKSKRSARLLFTTVAPYVLQHSALVPGRTLHNDGVNSQESVFKMLKAVFTSARPLNEVLMQLATELLLRWGAEFSQSSRPTKQQLPRLVEVGPHSMDVPMPQQQPVAVEDSPWGRGSVQAEMGTPENQQLLELLKAAFLKHKQFHGQDKKVRKRVCCEGVDSVPAAPVSDVGVMSSPRIRSARRPTAHHRTLLLPLVRTCTSLTAAART